MTRDELFSHCPSCGSRLNTHPDRVCMSCRDGQVQTGRDRGGQGNAEQNCGTEGLDKGLPKTVAAQPKRDGHQNYTGVRYKAAPAVLVARNRGLTSTSGKQERRLTRW